MLAELQQKKLGAYYTPPHVAQTLVRWVVRDAGDRLLDPSCGDGRFLAGHRNSVGVDCDVTGVVAASQGNRHSTIHVSGFFEWASTCRERFDCVAGNPPFIRYQHFVGRERELALQHCARLGARFTALTSSWAPFLVVAASLLKPNGRLAFVVPAEIGHAPYAAPLLEYLTRNFGKVQVVAIEKKLFPELSEDAWLLYAEGFSGSSNALLLTQRETFTCTSSPPRDHTAVTKVDLARWNGRLRPFLLPHDARNMYERLSESSTVVRLKEVARVGIGYVTGANDYFHFRPSTARFVGIPGRYLLPTVRNGRALPTGSLTSKTVERWLKRDEPVLLLRLPRNSSLPGSILDYLDSCAGRKARTAYKCRNRTPWYVVPDVRIPDAFLSYMSGEGPQLVPNQAGCTCTNSVHAVSMTNGLSVSELRRMWEHPLVRLSCEVEGHPLGGGMLKIEPGEAARIILPRSEPELSRNAAALIEQGIATMRRWRHYA